MEKKRVVSYSQYTTYQQCPQKYKLKHIDKLGTSDANIHTIFGNALHETIQEFLRVMYYESKRSAMERNWEAFLQEKMIDIFQDSQRKMGGYPCTKDELLEFYKDGCDIMSYFKGKINKFYPKQGFELVDIEYKLEKELKRGVYFWGFIDIILYDKIAGKLIIIDIKTSTKGWNKYQKLDKVKTSQMLLYKKLFLEEKQKENPDFDINDIDVEYHIMKRKVDKDPALPYHIPRITKFVPPNGKPSVNKAWTSFMGFLDAVFDENGEPKIDRPYPTNITKLCDYCEFKKNGICPDWKK